MSVGIMPVVPRTPKVSESEAGFGWGLGSSRSAPYLVWGVGNEGTETRGSVG